MYPSKNNLHHLKESFRSISLISHVPPAHTFFEKRSILENILFLTLAMIHPTCLHLCTKLLSKTQKGDAIHPEKSVLFLQYIDYQGVRK